MDKNATSRVKFMQWTWTSTHHTGGRNVKLKHQQTILYWHYSPLHYNWAIHHHLQSHHLFLVQWQQHLTNANGCWSRTRTVCSYRMGNHTTTHCAAVFPVLVRNITIMKLFKNIQRMWTRTQQVGINNSNGHGPVHITSGWNVQNKYIKKYLSIVTTHPFIPIGHHIGGHPTRHADNTWEVNICIWCSAIYWLQTSAHLTEGFCLW